MSNANAICDLHFTVVLYHLIQQSFCTVSLCVCVCVDTFYSHIWVHGNVDGSMQYVELDRKRQYRKTIKVFRKQQAPKIKKESREVKRRGVKKKALHKWIYVDMRVPFYPCFFPALNFLFRWFVHSRNECTMHIV